MNHAFEPSPAVLLAFERWAAAEYGCHMAQPCADKVMDELVEDATRHHRALAAEPAQNAADVVLKLFPAMLDFNGPIYGENPFVPVNHAEPNTDYLADRTWKALIADLAQVSPRIAELMRLPCRSSVAEHARQRRAA